MMQDYIPFVNGQRDCAVLKKHYKDAYACRVSLHSMDKLGLHLPNDVPLWIDAGVDIYHKVRQTDWPVDIATSTIKQISDNWPKIAENKKKEEWKFTALNAWDKQFKKYPSHRVLTEEGCWKKKSEKSLNVFISSILTECLKYGPSWISAPQLPFSSSVGKLNRSLAKAAGAWKTANSPETRFILPVVIESLSVLSSKTSRDKVIKLTKECYSHANASGVWVVDTSLKDQSRNEKYSKRYDQLIEFHKILRSALPGATIIGGPYWGINMVLWARGLCDFPAISLGTAYTYYIPWAPPQSGSSRIAIPPLRRWTQKNTDLKKWLNEAINRLSQTDTAYAEFQQLLKDYSALNVRDAAIDQVARFQKEWYQKIATLPQDGRAMGLYQDLSSAFVLGRQLPNLPKTALPKASAKILESGVVAEQLMLRCF
jgi:hypothetical protein